MSDVRRIVTVHAGTSERLRNELLGHIEEALLAAGAARVWIDTQVRPDLAVMVEIAGEPDPGRPAPLVLVPQVADLPVGVLD